jgi:hypothetical protein
LPLEVNFRRTFTGALENVETPLRFTSAFAGGALVGIERPVTDARACSALCRANADCIGFVVYFLGEELRCRQLNTLGVDTGTPTGVVMLSYTLLSRETTTTTADTTTSTSAMTATTMVVSTTTPVNPTTVDPTSATVIVRLIFELDFDALDEVAFRNAIYFLLTSLGLIGSDIIDITLARASVLVTMQLAQLASSPVLAAVENEQFTVEYEGSSFTAQAAPSTTTTTPTTTTAPAPTTTLATTTTTTATTLTTRSTTVSTSVTTMVETTVKSSSGCTSVDCDPVPVIGGAAAGAAALIVLVVILVVVVRRRRSRKSAVASIETGTRMRDTTESRPYVATWQGKIVAVLLVFFFSVLMDNLRLSAIKREADNLFRHE